MPVEDLIRYFNAADAAGESTLYEAGDRVEAWHGGLHLGSLFQPIVDLRRERVIGHQASLTVRRTDGRALPADTVFAASPDGPAVVHVDRLVRTLHALNFLAQRRHAGGYLQVAVHPRHLQAVSNQHGLVYEAILKRCGLGPTDIVLAIDASEIDLLGHGAQALANYRQRGYRLALSAPEAALGLPEALAIQPDILQVATADPTLCATARAAGALVEARGTDDGAAFRSALASGADLGLGRLFGEPAAACHPTHAAQRVAYNSPSSFGAHP